MLGGMVVMELQITTGMVLKARIQEVVLVMKLIVVKILDMIIGLGCQRCKNTVATCSIPSQPYERGECNCDARLDVNIDEGVLTSMNQLPVTQLNYGDSQARYSWINYELGQLRCYGKSRPYPNEEEIIEMFDDIHDNIKDLQQWIDKYDPSTYLRFYAMGDNSEFSGGAFPTPLIYNRIDYNLGNNFMKETGVFHAPQGKPKVDYSLFKFFKLVFTSLFSI